MANEVALEFYDVALVLICSFGVMRRLQAGTAPQGCGSRGMLILSFSVNLLGLASNSLTYLLRHSQVLYAAMLTYCDLMVLISAGGRRKLAKVAMSLAVLALLSYMHYRRVMFPFGKFCGYLACIINMFSVGYELSANAAHQSHVVDLPIPREVLVSNVMCSGVYMLMILQEGEALYSSHVEFLRWYGNTVAVIALDLLRIANYTNPRAVTHVV
jgi:hypothetical protein